MPPTRKKILDTAVSFYERRLEAVQNNQQDQLDSLDLEGEPTDIDEHSFIDQTIGDKVARESNQIAHLRDVLSALQRIQADDRGHQEVEFGSIVHTDLANLVVGAPIRRVMVEGTPYLGLSLEAPLGEKLLGCKPGDQVTYNDRTFSVKEIL